MRIFHFKCSNLIVFYFSFIITHILLPENISAQVYEVSYNWNKLQFFWDLQKDAAEIKEFGNGNIAWSGGLLPSYFLKMSDGTNRYVKAQVDIEHSIINANGLLLYLKLDELGNGKMTCEEIPGGGFMIRSLEVVWKNEIPKIVDLYFGTTRLSEKQKTVVSEPDAVFWPNWTSGGICIPSVKSSPALSFFSPSLFGSCDFALGSFGTSSSPYAAAFPRPLYALSLGSGRAWIAVGCGTIPNGAMYYKVKSFNGALQYSYREDLWGSVSGIRTWEKPLVMCADSTAWDSFSRLFRTIADTLPLPAIHQKSHWNSWGDFSKGDYNIRSIVDKAAQNQAELITIDMGWETSVSSGIPDLKKIPGFYNDLEYMKSKGTEPGFWQSLLWIKDTLEVGLTSQDLLKGTDGKPRLNNIFHNPFWADWSYYCLDPGSPTAREFLKNRTKNLIKATGAKLIKPDFGYATPPLDVAASVDPQYRGENYTYSLLKIIYEAAKEADPDITIQYYGINPLLKNAYNLVALDDMADCSGNEPQGHGEWSVWASLAGINGFAIMASSGYNWLTDSEIILNTAVVGSPGVVLSRNMPDGSPVPVDFINKRLAINKWYRKTTGWHPLWLNSIKGTINKEPELKCWGRLEYIDHNQKLTALALRDPLCTLSGYPFIEKLHWSGRWAIISQDNNDIFTSAKLAIIPIDKGSLEIPLNYRPSRVVAVVNDQETELKKYSYKKGIFKINYDNDNEAIIGFILYK